MYVCIYVCIYTCIHTHTHTHPYVCVCVFVCVCVCINYPGIGREMRRKERGAPGIVQSVLHVPQTRLVAAHTQVVADRS